MEIIAGEGVPLFVAPPLHRNTLRPFGRDNFVRYLTPTESIWRAVRYFGDRLNRFRSLEQAQWAGRDEAILR